VYAQLVGDFFFGEMFFVSTMKLDLLSVFWLPSLCTFTSSSVFLGIQPVSMKKFIYFCTLEALRESSLCAIVCLGRNSSSAYLHLLQLGCRILVIFPSHRIPLVSVKALSEPLGFNHMSSSLSSPSVLVFLHRSDFLLSPCSNSSLFWRSLLHCFSNCIVGGVWKLEVLCGENFVEDVSAVFENLSDFGLSAFESFYMEREGLNIFENK
jgi:hypothetical protein